jgi:hypothetical protein
MSNFFLSAIRMLLATCLLAQSFSANAQSARLVNLRDFLQPGETDITPAIRKAIRYCRDIRAKKLVIPKGVYHCRPDQAEERYLFISNNDEGLKRIVFPLDGMEDFEIDGQGATLVFHGFVLPFLISNSRNIQLHDLSIDWERPFHSEAKILSTGKDSMDIAVLPGYPYKIENGRLVFYGEDKAIYPYGGLLEFDPVRRETAYMAEDYWTRSDVQAAELPQGKLRIYWKGIRGTAGNILVFGPAGRYCPAVTVSDSRGIRIDSLRIFHCGAMGVIAQRSGDISISRTEVTPSHGRMVSTTSDATHFANCYGKLSITDCLFENQLDDAANIHGIYARIEKRLSPTSLLVALKHPQQAGFDFIKPGMELELVNSRSLVSYSQAKVSNVERLNKEYWRVQFTGALQAVRELDVIASLADTPTVILQRCRIRGNRARGILLGSRGPINIKDNYFHNGGAAILFEGDGVHWFEQGGVKQVNIEGNTFDNCNYGVWGNAVIQVGSGIEPGYRNMGRYHSNINVRNNVFRIFSSRLLNLYSVAGFRFEHNIIMYTNAYPDAFPGARLFEIANCDSVHIADAMPLAGNKH